MSDGPAIVRVRRALERGEYEYPLLAAPDGTVAVQIADLRAFVDTYEATLVALMPFARIVPSSIYDASGCEAEPYCVLIAPEKGNPVEFTGADLARARKALERSRLPA